MIWWLSSLSNHPLTIHQLFPDTDLTRFSSFLVPGPSRAVAQAGTDAPAAGMYSQCEGCADSFTALPSSGSMFNKRKGVAEIQSIGRHILLDLPSSGVASRAA